MASEKKASAAKIEPPVSKVDKIEKVLWQLICAGGGNGATIRRYARRIAQIKDSAA